MVVTNKVSKKEVAGGFIISDNIKKSWSLFKKEWITIYALMLAPMIVGMGYAFLGEGFSNQVNVGSFNFLLYLAYIVIQFVVGMGLTKGLLQVVRGKKVSMETFTSMFPHIFKYLGAQILMILIILGGFLLFIIPGFYFAMKYMFTPYLVIDKGMGPIEALKASEELTKGVKWDIIGFMGASVILMYSGALALLVGLLISVPVATLSYVVFYTMLVSRHSRQK